MKLRSAKPLVEKIDSILDLTGARGKVGFDLLSQDMIAYDRSSGR